MSIKSDKWIRRMVAEMGMIEPFSAEQVQSSAVQAQVANMATGANIGVQSIWSAAGSVPSQKPIVAIVDTGLDTNHYVIRDTWVSVDFHKLT